MTGACPLMGARLRQGGRVPVSLRDIINIDNPIQGWILESPILRQISVCPDTIQLTKKICIIYGTQWDDFRSVLAVKEIEKENNFDLDKLIDLGYNNYLSIFDTLIPPLLHAYDQLPASNSYVISLKEVVEIHCVTGIKDLRLDQWPPAVATEWANYLIRNGGRANWPTYCE